MIEIIWSEEFYVSVQKTSPIFKMTWKVVFNYDNGKFVKLILQDKIKNAKYRIFGKIRYKTSITRE